MMNHSATDGRVAIVTGGAKGYGYGIARALRQDGAAVFITGRDETVLHEASRKLDVYALRADVTVPGDWDRLIETVMTGHGRLDLLVNNAGGGVKIAPIDEQSDEQIARSIALNLTGPLLGCRRAAPIMKRQGSGMIVNISSVCAARAWPGFGPYSAAKAGLNQLGRCLHTELRAHGVRVTTVTPSWGATGFAAAAGIAGHPAGDADVRAKCMQPSEMGRLVLDLWRMPEHLVVPDLSVQPMVQEIVPM